MSVTFEPPVPGFTVTSKEKVVVPWGMVTPLQVTVPPANEHAGEQLPAERRARGNDVADIRRERGARIACGERVGQRVARARVHRGNRLDEVG